MTAAVPIPRRMAKLARDPRGYPIPANLYVDDRGRAHFTINDDRKRAEFLERRFCPICGTLLRRECWFVGGPLSAFHPEGWYLDLPMHDECCHYALRVCPYLAAPNYSGRIDARTIREDDPLTAVLLDNTMLPERPELFVAVESRGREVSPRGLEPYVRPVRPYLRVEYWRHGRRLDDREGAALAADALTPDIEPRWRAPTFITPRSRKEKRHA